MKENTLLQIQLTPESAKDQSSIEYHLINTGLLTPHHYFKIRKRSIDARKKQIKVNLTIEISNKPFSKIDFTPYVFPEIQNNAPIVTIIGAGPAGIFAALECILLNLKPVIIEQGKTIAARRRDLVKITRMGNVNPTSNYCFGEGGAGTYSDGKLYTRSTKRGSVQKVLELLVQHGADANILTQAHPHIGTNKLPQIIESMRKTILKSGGEIFFESKLIDLTIQNHKIHQISVEYLPSQEKKSLLVDQLILCSGHSGRSIFELLYQKNIAMEAKPFALGVRIEHSQTLIDQIQYHCSTSDTPLVRAHLPAASYNMVTQVNGRGVYSFCMCPGGVIAPCATENGEIVTNGWSPSKRNNPFANSGIVVETNEEDWVDFIQFGALRAMKFQAYIEQKMYEFSGSLFAPAQRMMDFINNTTSKSLPNCSYKPNVVSAPLHTLLPQTIVKCLQNGLLDFSKKMPMYLTNEALLVAVESRTSSPVKIHRDKVYLHHPDFENLYPCGEGAGYAGGIASAAIDGQRCVKAIYTKLLEK